MINTKPSEIIKDLFQALQKPDDIFMNQAVLTEAESYLTYKELDPIFKTLLLNKLYCYFLYPSYCLCDYYKKKCECRQKRKDALQACALKTYQMVLDTIQETKKIDVNDADIKAALHILRSTTGMTPEQAIEKLEDYKHEDHNDMLEQAQILTGIKDLAEYHHLQETINPQAHQWFEQLLTLTHDIKSYYTIALGIGRHLLSQIHILEQTPFKVMMGQKGHISLNQIVQEVLQGQSLHFYGGIKFSKIKLTHALYMYRSILPLMLGHLNARASLLGEDDLEVSILTFVTAYEIQNNFLKYSKKARIAVENKSLFTKNNLALVPTPSTFKPGKNTTMMGKSEGAVHQHKHTPEKTFYFN